MFIVKLPDVSFHGPNHDGRLVCLIDMIGFVYLIIFLFLNQHLLFSIKITPSPFLLFCNNVLSSIKKYTTFINKIQQINAQSGKLIRWTCFWTSFQFAHRLTLVKISFAYIRDELGPPISIQADSWFAHIIFFFLFYTTSLILQLWSIHLYRWIEVKSNIYSPNPRMR